MLLSFLRLAVVSGIAVNALDVGVAKLPILGYNTWNFYQCDINEQLIIETATLMQKYGLQAAGYNYVNIDDCWSLKNRTKTGELVADPAKFPSGIKNLTNTLHKMGFKTGIYSDAGWFTCGGFPGSYSYEDAQTFSEWGIDYLKYDNCAIPYDSITRQGVYGRYTPMRDALIAVAKKAKKVPIVFSLCEWGWDQVWLWGKEVGQSWRTTGDIAPTWPSLAHIINFNSFITSSTDYYGRNDLDMLQMLVGNGNLTYEEKKSHWTAWALMKSPLFIGTNLSAITPDTLSILTNREILAINQDPVYGESISPFRWGINPDWAFNATHPAQYWSGRSQNGTVVMMLNTLDEPAELSFNLTETPWLRAGRKYTIRDLWSHTNNGTAVRNITRTLPAHGVLALLLKDAGNEPAGLYPECSVWWQCTDRNGTRVGG
ncbi:glycoside hydrolase family 27 protein, partial [Rhizoctonia solani AG-3 Rhs1AP]